MEKKTHTTTTTTALIMEQNNKQGVNYQQLDSKIVGCYKLMPISKISIPKL